MTATNEPTFREADGDDVADLFDVRLSVVDNATDVRRLAEAGVTHESVRALISGAGKAWVCEADGRVAGFALADRSEGCVMALFVRPEFERRGIGGRLLGLAVDWLRAGGARTIWLATGADTRAAGFYVRRGWTAAWPMPNGDVRFELVVNGGGGGGDSRVTLPAADRGQ
jgi:GNAT superfamily N-acetyltransferase